MITISESSIIPHPLAEVFAIAADPFKQLEWDPGTLKRVEQVTPGGLGRGSRFRGDFKGYGVVEYEFAEYEPDRRFAHHTVMKFGEMHHRFEFEAASDGTRLTQSIRVEPKGIGKLMAPLMKGMFSKRLREIATEIGQYLGKATSTPGSSSTLAFKRKVFLPGAYRHAQAVLRKRQGTHPL
jgi:hypothetical protein